MASHKHRSLGHRKQRVRRYGVECEGCDGAGVSRDGRRQCGICAGRGYIIYKARS